MSNSRRSPSPPPSIASTHHSILPSVQSSSYFHGSNSNSSHTSAISSLSAPLQTGRSSLSGWSGENSDFGSSNNDFEFGIEGEGATETRGHWHGGMINQGSNSGGIEYEKQIQQGPGGIKAKPFIQKLAYVLSKPELFGDVLRWDATGTSFILSHTAPRLVATVLPQIWGHSNLSSFSRQLGVYNFTRLQASELAMLIDVTHSLALPLAEYSGYTNPYFLRADDSEMYRLRPKPTAARQLKKDEKKRDALSSVASGGGGSGPSTGGSNVHGSRPY